MFIKKTISVLLASLIIFGTMSVSLYAYEDKPDIWNGKAADCFAGGDGTEESPYKIETAEQLALLAEILNNYTGESAEFNAELVNDIYLNKTDDWELWGNDNYDDKNLNKWVPIRLINYEAIGDDGIYYYHINSICFNGNNHYIFGLYINNVDEDNQGLFSYADKIKNLNLSQSYINGKNFVGSIAGIADEIESCQSFVRISGQESVGGIAGSANKIESCQSFGNISGQESVGGIAGTIQSVNNCTNNADVNGVTNIGGIFGETVIETYIAWFSGYDMLPGYSLTADNCKNNGNIQGTDYVGGISGNDETISSSFNLISTSLVPIIVSDCCNNGSVTGKNYVAGIIPVGVAELSFNTGNIKGNLYIGGISGLSDNNMISNCYNTGNIEGQKYVGGIAGHGTVYFSYNTGKITGNQKYGPICGDIWIDIPENIISNLSKTGANTSQEVNISTSVNCYYLDNNEIEMRGDSIGTAIALTSNQMSKPYCYKNWDFENIWTISPESKSPEFIKDKIPFNPIEYNYVHKWDGKTTEPFFSDESHNGKDENHPYLIYNVKQLAYIAERVRNGENYNNKYFKLENDIDINGTKDNNGNKIPWVRYATEWTSIGSDIDYLSSKSENIFQGSFDGGNHKINGLYGNCLFGKINNCVIKNIKITDSYIHSQTSSGGICQNALNSVFENCSFDGYIYGYHVGSISCLAQNTVIENCVNAGTLLGTLNVGGISCEAEECIIKNCYNTGSISGIESLGGIVGTSQLSNISESFNSGNISGQLFLGGIVGDCTMNENSKIENCYNNGFITCSYIGAGGITGVIDDVSSKANVIQNCYNSGIVSIEKTEYEFINLEKIYSTVAKNIVNGCITGIIAPNSIKSYYKISDCYYLENSYCRGSTGISLALGRDSSKSLSAEDMQNEKSFPESWFSKDGAWTLTNGNKEYLFPQLKGLPHVPGNEYTFSYVSAESGETKIASASPYIFSNQTNYFNSLYKMDGIYEELFDCLLNENTQNSVLAKAEVAMYKMQGSIYGHCFGMSAVMALYMTGLIDVNDFQWQAKSPFDFLNPVNSNTIESLINYFQLSQNITTLSSKINRQNINRETRNKETVDELIKALKTNDCVLLGIYSFGKRGSISADFEHHCVVVYNNGELTENGGTIGIWDPNTSQSVTGMTIEKSADGSYNVTGSMNDFYLGYAITVNDLFPAYDLLNKNISLLNLDSFSFKKAEIKSNSLKSTSEQSINSTNLITSYDNFKITDKNNNTATVSHGEVQKSSTLEMDNGVIISENKDLPLRQFELPENSSSYTITPLESSSSDITLLSSEKEKWYSIVDSDGTAEIDFNLAKKEVSTDSEEKIIQRISSGYEEADTSWNNIEIEGYTEGIDKKIDENTCCFSSDSDTEMTITASDGINETDKCSIEVEQNQEAVISEITNTDEEKSRKMEIDNGYKEILGYTVFFVSGIDECNESVSVEPGKTVAEPETIKNPVQSSNYVFKGWYTEDGEKWDFKNDTVNSNIRLIAKWEEIEVRPQVNATVLGIKVQMKVSGIDNFERITWNSLNGKVATIDSESGLITLKKRGVSIVVATIYTEDTIYESQYSLRVYDPIEYIFVRIADIFKAIFTKLSI